MPTTTFLLYGQPDPPPALVPLCAGPLTMLFDPTTGFVRRIRLGQREVLRGMYAAVRDPNWNTIPGMMRETARVIAKGVSPIIKESHTAPPLPLGAVCGVG